MFYTITKVRIENIVNTATRATTRTCGILS